MCLGDKECKVRCSITDSTKYVDQKVAFTRFFNIFKRSEIESCTGSNEVYSDTVVLNGCGDSCRRNGCRGQYIDNYANKWSPNCKCSNDNYKRLSNGTCVPVLSEECVAEFQPSPGSILNLVIVSLKV